MQITRCEHLYHFGRFGIEYGEFGEVYKRINDCRLVLAIHLAIVAINIASMPTCKLG